jgi:hypothetical protein
MEDIQTIKNNIILSLKNKRNVQTIAIKEQYNKILASGLLLPKDKVSRNGVLYDWESAKNTVTKIKGLPMMYNHQVEGNQKPVGHFTDAIALEKRPSEGKWQEVWDKAAEELNTPEGIPGVYYEADINPNSEYADSVTRGDVRKVSIQVIPDEQVKETTDDGDSYTRAYIKDYVESSVVPSPGFMETTLSVMCENFNIKKIKESNTIKIGDKVHCPSGYSKVIGVNGNKITVRSQDPAGDFEYDISQVQKENYKEELKVDMKHIQKLKDNNIDFTKIGNELLIDESNNKVLDGLGIPYKESLKEDDVEKGLFPSDEFNKGLKIEQAEHPNLNVLEAGQLVLDHLKEDEYYYSNKESQSTANNQGAMTVKIPEEEKCGNKKEMSPEAKKVLDLYNKGIPAGKIAKDLNLDFNYVTDLITHNKEFYPDEELGKDYTEEDGIYKTIDELKDEEAEELVESFKEDFNIESLDKLYESVCKESPKAKIWTVDGQKTFVKEVDDKEFERGDYSTNKGYWVTHNDGKHQIYESFKEKACKEFISDEDEEKIKKDYRNGRDLDDIAYDYNVSVKLIKSILNESFSLLDKLYENVCKEKLPGDSNIQNKIMKMIKQGYSQDEIREETGYEISDRDYKIFSERVCKEDYSTWTQEQKDYYNNLKKWDMTALKGLLRKAGENPNDFNDKDDAIDSLMYLRFNVESFSENLKDIKKSVRKTKKDIQGITHHFLADVADKYTSAVKIGDEIIWGKQSDEEKLKKLAEIEKGLFITFGALPIAMAILTPINSLELAIRLPALYGIVSLLGTLGVHKIKQEIEDIIKSKVLNEAYGKLSSDQSDILEGIVLSNKNKDKNAILIIAKKEEDFKNINDKDLLEYIEDIKEIYQL